MAGEEYEVKFLNVDPTALEVQILALGGEKVFDRVFRNVTFDYPDLRLDAEASWVRVRDEGEQVTLAFKQRLHHGGTPGEPGQDRGMLEEEVVVSDYETACAILRRIGLTDKFQQEKRRIRYTLGGVELDIDYWPQLEPYLEIEGDSWAAVDGAIAKLGLDPAHKKICSATQVYALAGIRDKDYKIMTFERMVKR